MGGILNVCIGDNFLIILLRNGVILSKNKQKKDNAKETNMNYEFSEIRLNKKFNFRRHHNKREVVRIQQIACYNGEGDARCVAVGTNNDIYEWKGGSTDAHYTGNVNG